MGLWVALGVVSAAHGTRADELAPEARDTARALADEGANAFAQRDYARAHDRLQRAFALVQAPTIAVLDARALVGLGRLVEAQAAYRKALAVQVEDTSPVAFRDAVSRAREEFRLLEQRLPRLVLRIKNAPRNARLQVWLDGTAVALRDLGKPLPADPKLHSIRLDVDGQPAAVHRVFLREGESELIELEPPSRAGSSRTLSIAGFGLGGAGLIAGIVTGSMALAARDDAESRCLDQRCEAGSRGAASLDDFRMYRTFSTIGYSVGLAGLAFGTVMLFSGSGSDGVQVGLVPSWDGVRIRGAL
jgi:tetratricopeptide (TPR) repeat protein